MSVDDSVQQLDGSKKKKKTKRKQKDEDLMVSEDPISTEKCKDTKKKLKKKDGPVSEISQPNGVKKDGEESVVSKPAKKKKKRRHKEEDCDSSKEEEVSEPIPNKSKSKNVHSSSIEESSLGVVDKSILKQAKTNLGLPLEEEVAVNESDSKPAKKKKKKEKKKDKVTTDQPAEPADDRSSCEKALEYLNTWHTDKKSWKFNKHLQVKLLHVLYDMTQMADDNFSVMLLYLEGLNGKSREKTKEEAGKILAEAELETNDVDSDKEERARQIFQLLS